MTTVGHSLTGLSLAALTIPAGLPRRRAVALSLCFVLSANLPDLPLPGWGHSAYFVSHSLFVTATLAGGLILLLRRYGPGSETIRGLDWALALSWLSHMLLDATYAHGEGLAVFWPFSDTHLALPIAWFETLNLPVRSAHNLEVLRRELIVFGTILLAVAASRIARRTLARRRRRREQQQ